MAKEVSGEWTVDTYAIYNEALRQADKELQIERDRRYAEVGTEREKALRIKETADLAALELARESQTYKEARNDAMREQSLKETGVYVTRDDLADVVATINKSLKPLVDYVSSQQGASQGSSITIGRIFAMIAAMGTIIGIIVVLANAFMR